MLCMPPQSCASDTDSKAPLLLQALLTAKISRLLQMLFSIAAITYKGLQHGIVTHVTDACLSFCF